MPFPAGRLELKSAETRAQIRRNRVWMQVVKDFRWVSSDRIKSVTVPEGFTTDVASIGWFFRRFIGGAVGPYRGAAVIHDCLYSAAGVHGRSRKQCDWIFRDILLEIGVRKWRAYCMYWGVRLGGWRPWSRYEKANIAESIRRAERP